MAGSPTATVTGLTIGGTGQFGTGLQGTAGPLASNKVEPGWTGTHTGSWTISMWINIPTPPTTRYMFGNSAGNGTFRCFVGGAANGIRLTGGVPSITLDMSAFSPGAGHVITYVYDATAGAVSGYIDGVYQAQATPGSSYPLVGTNFVIGAQGTSIDGTMDEFRIYNRALTATEIQNTWDEQLPLITGPNDAGVTAYTSPVNFCTGTNDVKVMVKNFGNNLVSGVQVGWMLNNVLQTPQTVSTPLVVYGNPGTNEIQVTLGNYNFTGAPVSLKAWTYLPNSVADVSNANDTLTATLAASLSGTYTINSGVATGGTNYNSFAAFTSALNTYGICGPVIANVVAGSGPYNEVVVFEDVDGSSAVNTIRVNGNGAMVQYSNTTSERQLLTLDGAQYLTIDSLTFKSLSATYGWGARIAGGATRDTITRCFFDLTSVTSTTAANVNGILFSGSATATTTAGINGTHCFIANNHLKGSGAAGGMNFGIGIASGGSDSNIIRNNIIENFYNNGIYLNAAQGTLVENNEIHRANKTAGIVASEGIATISGDMAGSRITGNRIYSPAGTAGSTTVFRALSLLGDGTAANPVVVANNVIYKMNQGGASSGIYISAALNNKVYHNTIVLDQVLGGTAINYGIYATGTNTGTDVKNNLVSITEGTGGVKYGFYYSALASVNDAQRNCIYVNSNQAGVQNYGYYTAAYTDQATFQTAYPTLEQGSLTVNPQFVNAANGNFLPGNALLSANGVNLFSDVAVDINGALRSVLPTPGAYEIPPVQGPDAGLLSLISPAALFCAGQQPVQISVINSGTQQISSFQVHWKLNNIVQAPFTFSGLLDTAGGAGQYIDTVTIGTVNIPPGNNTIQAWIVLPGDINDINDSLLVSVTPAVFSISSLINSVCGGGDVTMNLSPSSGYNTGMLAWESSPDGAVFTPIAGTDNMNYTANNLTANQFYRVFINSGTTGCYSDTLAITVTNPTITGTTDGSNCGPGAVQLSAAASAGATINWFDNPSGGTSVGTGTTLTTPSISVTTTYYAQASIGGGMGSVGPLTPASVGTNAGTAAAITTYHMAFDVLSPTTLISVDIFPGSAAIGSSGTIVIQDNTSSVIATVPYTTTVTGGTTAQTVTLNVPLAPGTGYKIGQLAPAINLIRNSTGGSYPYTSSAINIVSNNFGAAYYYYFYNWQFSSGCEGPLVPVTATINDIPVVDLGNDIIACTDGTSTEILNPGATTGATYLWDNNTTAQTRVVNTSGAYHVTVTANGCTESDTIQVTFNDNPVVNLGNDTAVCDNVILILDAQNPGASYEWDDMSTSVTRNATTGGLYYVTVTDANNCIGSDSLHLITTASPVVNIGNDTAICDGAILTLDAGNPGLPTLWDNGSVNQTRTVSDSGTYYVSVTAAGCPTTDSINISFVPAPVADGIVATYGDAATYSFYPLNAQHSSTYTWNFGDGSPTATGYFVQHTYADNGIYSVTLSLEGTCEGIEAAVSRTVDVFDADGATNINSYNLEQSLNLYPNPALTKVTIEGKDGLLIEEVSIFNIAGQEIWSHKGSVPKLYVDVESWTSGLYLVKIKSNRGVIIKKIETLK
jgi:hypothetical protein